MPPELIVVVIFVVVGSIVIVADGIIALHQPELFAWCVGLIHYMLLTSELCHTSDPCLSFFTVLGY